MAIRAFLSPWTLANGRVDNPIVDYVDTLPDHGIVCQMFYPDRNADGIPDLPLVLVFVSSPQLTGTQIETQAANITGITMIPAIKPSILISSLTSAQKTAYVNALNNFGVPLSAINGATTVGDAFVNLLNYISPNLGLDVANYLFSLGVDFV